MHKIINILILLIFISSSFCLAQDSPEKIPICLRDFDTSPDEDLTYIVRAINTTIINCMAQFPEIKAYSSEMISEKYFSKPDSILGYDKVQLLPIRRETGFDGLIFGRIENLEAGLKVTMHLLDFSSGRIYFSGTFDENFGSSLLGKLEEKVALYAKTLISYYDCILAVTSEPEGAEVWLNGEKKGETPANKLDVKDGKTEVQIKKEGYIPYKTEIELRSGQKGSIHAQLYKHSLTATSTPSEALIYINDKYIGKTPIKDFILKQNEFKIQFTKDGFAPFSKDVSIKPGQEAYIHAELYDLITDHLRNKESIWEIDAHNFTFFQTWEVQSIKEFDIDIYPTSSFRYQAKFGKIYAGFGMAISPLSVAQHFDTFLGPGEGYEPFNIDITKGIAFCHYNILDKIGWLEIYVGPFAGILSSKSTQYNAPAGLMEMQKVNPLLGGEFGINFYLSKMIKISGLLGGCYGGNIDYAMKEATYWGEAKYTRKEIGLHPFYAGLGLTVAIWPALIK